MNKDKTISEKILVYGSLFLIVAFYTASIILPAKREASWWEPVDF